MISSHCGSQVVGQSHAIRKQTWAWSIQFGIRYRLSMSMMLLHHHVVIKTEKTIYIWRFKMFNDWIKRILANRTQSMMGRESDANHVTISLMFDLQTPVWKKKSLRLIFLGSVTIQNASCTKVIYNNNWFYSRVYILATNISSESKRAWQTNWNDKSLDGVNAGSDLSKTLFSITPPKHCSADCFKCSSTANTWLTAVLC